MCFDVYYQLNPEVDAAPCIMYVEGFVIRGTASTSPLTSPGPGRGKRRDPGNEVGSNVRSLFYGPHHLARVIYFIINSAEDCRW